MTVNSLKKWRVCSITPSALKENGREQPPLHYGELADSGWSELQRRAIEELGKDTIPNLTALGLEGRGVYLPAQVQTASFPLSRGGPLKCASLLGLRNELVELAERWELPLDDEGLQQLLRVAHDPDDGWVADAPEILTFARLVLAANEAARRDCPLWLVGPRSTGAHLLAGPRRAGA